MEGSLSQFLGKPMRPVVYDVLDPIRSTDYLRVRQERQRALRSYCDAARFDAEELARIQAAGVAGAGAAAGTSFKILSDAVTYRGWRSMRRKEVAPSNGRVASFDIVSQGAPPVIVFVWEDQHPYDRMLHGTVAGIYEEKKHDSLLSCARFELEEEAQLRSDHWVPATRLCPSISTPTLSSNRSLLWTVLNPRPLDDEEYIVIERGVGYKRIMELICDGSMNVPSAYVCLLAFEKLRSMGYTL
jgi:hypothetical protein